MLQNKTTGCMPVSSFFFMEVLFSSRTIPSNPWTEVAKFKTCLGKRSYRSQSNFHYVWIILRENKLVYSENLNVVTMITPIITYLSFYFFFYRCLKTRSLSSYTYTKCSYPLLSKRNCFLLFLLLPATLNNMHSFFSSKEKLAASYGERTKKN